MEKWQNRTIIAKFAYKRISLECFDDINFNYFFLLRFFFSVFRENKANSRNKKKKHRTGLMVRRRGLDFVVVLFYAYTLHNAYDPHRNGCDVSTKSHAHCQQSTRCTIQCTHICDVNEREKSKRKKKTNEIDANEAVTMTMAMQYHFICKY